MAQAVREKLESFGYAPEPEAVDMCVQLAAEFGLAPVTVAEDYEVMASLKENASMDVTVSHVNSKAFKDFLTKQRGQQKATRLSGNKQPFGNSWDNVSDREAALYQPTPKRQATGPGSGTSKTPSNNLSARTPAPRPGVSPAVMGRARMDSPATAGAASQQTPSASAVKFQARTTKGDLVSTLNDTVPEWDAAACPSQGLLPIEQLGEPLPVAGQHLFMTETLETRIQAVEERLMDWADHLIEAVPDLDRSKLHAVNQITQEPGWCVGRVVLEAASEDGPATRLSVNTLVIEGCRGISDGARVRLDLAPLMTPGATGTRLFPGQVIGVYGVNPTGQTIIAHKVCNSLPAPRAAAVAPRARPVSVMVAAGPFTTSNDLCYVPLEQILEHCAARSPDALILTGPFVDSDHTLVQTGALEQTLEKTFEREVLKRVTDWQVRNPRTRVILLPSTRDAHHAPVHPTPAFALPTTGANAPVVSYSSPALLKVADGVTIGVTSADVLKALSGAEIAVGAAGTDRMAALSAHVIAQRSFFPVSPAPLGTCIDASHTSGLTLTASPDILILPSDLGPFAKAVTTQRTSEEGPAPHSFVCINPGRTVRGTSGGTFAMICVQPEGPVPAASRVELRKV